MPEQLSDDEVARFVAGRRGGRATALRASDVGTGSFEDGMTGLRGGAGAAVGRWQRTSGASQTVWWVTPAEAAGLDEQVTALAMRYQDRLLDPAARPSGAAPVEFVALTHLWDAAQVPDDAGDRAAHGDRARPAS